MLLQAAAWEWFQNRTINFVFSKKNSKIMRLPVLCVAIFVVLASTVSSTSVKRSSLMKGDLLSSLQIPGVCGGLFAFAQPQITYVELSALNNPFVYFNFCNIFSSLFLQPRVFYKSIFFFPKYVPVKYLWFFSFGYFSLLWFNFWRWLGCTA